MQYVRDNFKDEFIQREYIYDFRDPRAIDSLLIILEKVVMRDQCTAFTSFDSIMGSLKAISRYGDSTVRQSIENKIKELKKYEPWLSRIREEIELQAVTHDNPQ